MAKRSTPEGIVATIHMFGPILVEIGPRRLGPRDLGGVKPKQILEILVLGRGSPVPKDRIADVLWGEDLPRNVSATIETYVSLLRRSLDPDGGLGKHLIVTEREAYRVAADSIDLDLDRFQAFVEQARTAEATMRRRYLEDALAIAGGDVLADEPYTDWAERVRDHYRGLFVEAAVGAAELALGDGDFSSGLTNASRVIAVDPYSEQCYRMAMVTLYALGRRKEALDLFEQCRRTLLDDLDATPQSETEEIATAVRQGTDLDRLLPQFEASMASTRVVQRSDGRRHITLLLVEDNPADSRMIAEALKGSASDIELIVATDGVQALAMLRNAPPHTGMARPDLVLLDLYLPKLSGTEVLTQIKADPDLRRIPVVILTRSDADQDILLCYDLGANGYVTKPTDPDEFVAVVGAIESFWPATAALPPS